MGKIDDLINEAFKEKKSYQDFNVNRLEIIAKTTSEDVSALIIKELLNKYNTIIKRSIKNYQNITDSELLIKYNFIYPSSKYVDLIHDNYERQLYLAAIKYNILNMRNKIAIVHSSNINNKSQIFNNNKKYVVVNELIKKLALYNIKVTFKPDYNSEEGIIEIKSYINQIDEMIEKNNTLKRKKEIK